MHVDEAEELCAKDSLWFTLVFFLSSVHSGALWCSHYGLQWNHFGLQSSLVHRDGGRGLLVRTTNSSVIFNLPHYAYTMQAINKQQLSNPAVLLSDTTLIGKTLYANCIV